MLNKNDKRRHEILGLNFEKSYDIKRCNITSKQLEQLNQEGFLDLDDAQNNSPDIREFIKFLELATNFHAIGYIVNPNRKDYRVTIEGVETREKLTTKELIEFVAVFHHADEFELQSDYAYAWFD